MGIGFFGGRWDLFFARQRENFFWVFFLLFFGCFFVVFWGCFCCFLVFFFVFRAQREFFFGFFFPR